MATVPTYREPQVREQALRPVQQGQVDVSSGTRALAAGLGQLGEAADKIDLQRSQAAADQIDAQISTDWLKWDSENRPKYRGQNAEGYEPAASEWWQKRAEEAGKNLSPRAQALANRALVRKQQAALGNVVQFVGAERERHADDSAAASIGSTIQFGVTTGDTAGAAAQVREQVAKIGARKGWTTEQVQSEQLKNLSMLHLAQVTKLSATDANAARSYYEANKGEIAAQNQPRVEEVLTGEADNQFATQFAATNGTLPYAEQIKKAGEIENPQRREKVLLAVKNQQAQIREAQRANEESASDQAWQLFAQGRAVPEAILSQMDGKDRAQLAESRRARAERGAKGTTVKTDPANLAKIYDMMRDDPEGFKKLRMGALVDSFSTSDIEQVSRIQRDMLKPDTERNAVTAIQAIDTYVDGMSKSDAALYKRRALTAIDDFQLEKGRAPNITERRQLLDDLTIEVVTHKGMLWDTKEPAFKAKPDQRGKPAEVPAAQSGAAPAPRRGSIYAISGEDRRLITEALRAERVPVDENTIQERYRVAKGLK